MCTQAASTTTLFPYINSQPKFGSITVKVKLNIFDNSKYIRIKSQTADKSKKYPFNSKHYQG